MTTNLKLYPLRFNPVYKPVMWGGDQLTSVLGRELPETEEPIGESWELVDRDDAQSVVANGALQGKTIRELIEEYGSLLLGKNFNQNSRFPLLIKLIDAGQRLSLQVHPDAAASQQLGEGAEPKTEMWYIIASKPGAKIIAGLNTRSTRQQLMSSLGSSEIEKHLQVFKSEPGDAYFIYSGTIHAIGEGNLLLEIQQNSDTTYRVSDWGRKDRNGNSRELHLEQALKAIDFMNRTSPRITGVTDTATHNRKFPVINHCPFFKVDDLRLTGSWLDTTALSKSFHLISAITGPVEVGNEGFFTALKPGETCLVPACTGDYRINPLQSGETTVLRTNI
ncbi:MAG: class I mannose-6-phosphate isomerase [Victivallaceae bacterium]|nr:class I mannose-6-phosphate isomerase [Victivallaceae bacterium]MDD4180659.1 class I mannose-6-phosphate isomerase [Victivallaceae bacterium]